ncbi:hypothetical protein SNE35_09835 [Paucibacter sp. R3-3]|uniref:HEPN AbiU2-like domain-containing protein n=1 Tax=Roseateles agri TaxID=3098619 RepID=A0ABU5DHV1_9BURK|nr:hypothetical protein [Paucibacter sp. R3-3]MDY0744809.1 hypothetical protein [Paucibacter sp. R3-3]
MTKPTSTQLCEDVLREGIEYNITHNIWPSLNAIAARMLARSTELTDAYEELAEKLDARHKGLNVFFDVLLGATYLRNPVATAQSRADRAELVRVNAQIAEVARELATLIERRSEIHNTTDFHSDTHYSVCGVIEAAAERIPLFESWVKEPLGRLSYQFDLKYWPSIGDFALELAEDAERATPVAMDAAAAAATTGKRASPKDFFSALLENLDESTRRYGGFLPTGFSLTDRTLATLGTCVLDRGPDEPFDADYVKSLRQKLRRQELA